MLKLLAISIAALSLLPTFATATTPCDVNCTAPTGSTPATAGSASSSSVNTTSGAAATNAGNNQSIIFSSAGSSTSTVNQIVSGDTTNRVVYSGTQTVRNVPSVSGPSLTSSNDTCMGSVSGSVNIAGFGGGFGTTYKDVNCVMLKNSRELWNMGMKGAALARMCMDGENREALELTGFQCPQTLNRTSDQFKQSSSSVVPSGAISSSVNSTTIVPTPIPLISKKIAE